MSRPSRSVLRLLLAFVVVGAVACSGETSSEWNGPRLSPMRFPDPAESPYCLPYPVGDTATVSQSWSDSESGTHRGRFAYDFDMPFGSQISAARGGTVTEIRDQYHDYELVAGHENGVFVLHDDGTMAAYLHMSEDGVLVDVGDTVTTGQVIGLVGTTGTAVPHLHFEVFEGQDLGTQWYRSLPVSFRNATTPLDRWGGLLRTGYESFPCEAGA